MLLISPEVYRGFSGEGQNLEALAGGRWKELLPAVRAQVNWNNEINAEEIASAIGTDLHLVEQTLAALGARGLAGYDATTGKYFHRELPFDQDEIDALQPRLKGALKLLDEGRVKLHESGDDGAQSYLVGGSDVDHFVRVLSNGERCTCPWYSKHPSERGPCKHILAVQMFMDNETESRE